jgi:hypothetical protein
LSSSLKTNIRTIRDPYATCVSFSCSRGLIIPLKPKSSGDWVANGLIIVNNDLDLKFIGLNIDIIVSFMNPLDPLFKDHWI